MFMALLALYSPNLPSVQLKKMVDLLITLREKPIPYITTQKGHLLLSPQPCAEVFVRL